MAMASNETTSNSTSTTTTNSNGSGTDSTGPAVVQQPPATQAPQDNLNFQATAVNKAALSASPQQYQADDLNRVIQSIREVISCCACFTSDFGMKECVNGHLLCHTCFLTLRQDDHPQCPTCRAALYPDSRKALTAQKVLSELPDLCVDCGEMMLRKDLTGHRLNNCPRRRVSCGLSPLGCGWCGSAEEYHGHYENCEVRRCLQERPLEESLTNVLGRFRRREQMLRETFTCFSALFRHLDGFELQSVSVPLNQSRVSPDRLIFKSDQFHGCQSRWSMKLIVQFDEAKENAGSDVAATEEAEVETLNATEEMVSTATPNLVATATAAGTVSETVQEQESNSNLRARRVFRFSRFRPYPDWRQSRGSNSSNAGAPGVVTESSQSQSEGSIHFGELSFTITKENSPAMGRKHYAFIPLQIESSETGAQVSLRPLISAYRFSSRGDRSGVFGLFPMRWRYLTNLAELRACRLLNLEMVIGRKLLDDQQEQA